MPVFRAFYQSNNWIFWRNKKQCVQHNPNSKKELLVRRYFKSKETSTSGTTDCSEITKLIVNTPSYYTQLMHLRMLSHSKNVFLSQESSPNFTTHWLEEAKKVISDHADVLYTNNLIEETCDFSKILPIRRWFKQSQRWLVGKNKESRPWPRCRTTHYRYI